MLRVLICQGVYYFMCLYICVYYGKSDNMSRSLLFHVFIYIYIYIYGCTMVRVIICQGVCVYIYVYVCTMLRGLICQGVYYFIFLYIVLC